MTKKDKPQKRTLTFHVEVTVPEGMGDRKARRLLDKLINAGLSDATETTDGDFDPDTINEAEEALSLDIRSPQLPKPNEIIVVIEGGCCSGVFSRDPNVNVDLLDWDNVKDGDATPAERGAAKKLEKRTEKMKAVF